MNVCNNSAANTSNIILLRYGQKLNALKCKSMPLIPMIPTHEVICSMNSAVEVLIII